MGGPRWEHLVVTGADQARLTALGEEGWELVAVLPGEAGATCYLKRPGLDFRERVTIDQKRRYYATLGATAAGEEGGG